MFRPFLLLALSLSLAAPAGAQADRGAAMNAALREASTRNWDAAASAARPAGQVGGDVVEWMRLRAGDGNFGTYTAFLGHRPDWPGLALIRQKGEAVIPPGTDPDRVIAYFRAGRPATGKGSLALIAALRSKRLSQEAEAEAVRAWKTLPLSEQEQADFISTFPTLLSRHHVQRLDTLLWRERLTEAQRMIPLVGPDWQALAKARIMLRRDQDGVNAAIAAVPKALQDDPGLAWERFAWRMRKSQYAEAAAFLDQRSTSAGALGQPEVWAERRALLARREMREGDARRAYRLASRHFLTEGSDYADLEWLAGYIALRKLDDPQRALKHFQAMRAAVESPISLGRAGYWEGRAYEAMGRPDAARTAYAFGAGFQTGFYGLLAAERAGVAMDPGLIGNEKFPDWKTARFARSSLLEAALLLQKAGARDLSKRFFLQLAEGLNPTELGQLADLALSLDEPHIALSIAKEAASRGIVLPRAYFPVMGLARMDLPVARELALAIARRESEFDAAVVSSAGARGLMQVMPGTAELVSRRIGVEFTPAKLTTDWRYNAQIGSAYLAQLREEFGGAVALVAAGYNAGPNRSREWIAKLGDPRGNVDVVDWIEHIPFTETRNYVMRVAESIPVYRARLSGKPVKVELTRDLTAR